MALSTNDAAPTPQGFGAFNLQGVGFNRETGKGYVKRVKENYHGAPNQIVF